MHLAAARGPYAGSSEELTPVQSDWMSAVPLAMTAALLLASPQSASKLARGGFGAHLLDPGSIRVIENEDFYRHSSSSPAKCLARRHGRHLFGHITDRLAGGQAGR
ncbi:hypothetical protein [Bradyrhizobium australiense]|uniref:hypothetical protein n=1 Tax=Bradyrhizobium australiense TaxID=2721161 RepID=UPI001AED1D07|nr:hypothetical protein [Bradyrhizobium australiense]